MAEICNPAIRVKYPRLVCSFIPDQMASKKLDVESMELIEFGV